MNNEQSRGKETLMALSKEQEDLYRKTMQEAKAQLETIDDDMEKEIQRARERLAKLQESKRSFRQLYEGAARLLGEDIESDDHAHVVNNMTAAQDPSKPPLGPRPDEAKSESDENSDKTDGKSRSEQD
jgi:hypothetical protein